MRNSKLPIVPLKDQPENGGGGDRHAADHGTIGSRPTQQRVDKAVAEAQNGREQKR